METEIEIKFFFNEKFENELTDILNTYKFISTKKQFLHNVYYDTQERLLRKENMGLRIRTSDNLSTQTMKTAGRVIGGLYQRPEYNEEINAQSPDLSLFDKKIWPKDFDVLELEKKLISIFTTDFHRRTWLIEIKDDTLIEVAFDLGSIEINDAKAHICEIELELVKGNVKQLFLLASDIAKLPEVRLGNISKAQRGYMLADETKFTVDPLHNSSVSADNSINEALLTNLQHGLAHMQHNENCFIENSNFSALYQFQYGVMFLHQNLNLFSKLVPELLQANWINDLQWIARSFLWIEERKIYNYLLENRGHYIRKIPTHKKLLKILQKRAEQLPSTDEIKTKLTSTRYCQFILKLTQWLIEFEKSSVFTKTNTPVKKHARMFLSKEWDKLFALFSTEDKSQLEKSISSKSIIASNLIMGLSFENIFDNDDNNDEQNFYSPWLDIKQGVAELSMLQIINEIAQEISDHEEQKEYMKWIKNKENSLLNAIDRSAKQALIKDVYWLKDIKNE